MTKNATAFRSYRGNDKYREIYYALELNKGNHYVDNDYLSLNILQRERGQRGKLGKIKRFSADWSEGLSPEDLPNGQDFEIFSKYQANIFRGSRYGYYAESNNVTLRFPHALALDALAEIFRTGRLVTSEKEQEAYSSSSDIYRALAFVDKPYLFRAKVDPDADHWKLSGAFLHEDKEIAYDQCHILHPRKIFSFTTDMLVPFEVPPNLNPFIETLMRKGMLKLPIENREDLRGFVNECIGIGNTVFDKTFGIEKKHIQGTPVFDIHIDEEAIMGSLFFMYEEMKHPPLSADNIDDKKNTDVFFPKDIDYEKSLLKEFNSISHLQRVNLENSYTVKDEHFYNAVESLEKLGIEIRAEGKKLSAHRGCLRVSRPELTGLS